MDLTEQVDSVCKSRNYVKLDKWQILALSFNVNAKIEESENIAKILDFESYKCQNQRADLIIVGLQEVVELSPTNVVGSAVLGNITESLDKWVTMFLDTLNTGIYDKNDDRYGLDAYVAHTMNQMVGTVAIMFALSLKVPLLKNVQTAVVPRGMGNVLGNKGGVCIRLEINNTSICFVTCHLTAHREQVSKRNDDYYAIITAKVFTEYEPAPSKPSSDPKISSILKDIQRIRGKLPASVTSKIPSVAEELSSMVTYSPDDHDILIWLGDLNYRIREGESLDDVYNMIYDNATDTLSSMDQLVIEMQAGNAFEGFQEGKLNFSPTYQYIPGSDIYDRREDKKKRCPAWCDRILWRVGKGTERLKSVLMNFRADGNILLDMMKLPYPSAVQNLDPAVIQNLSQELFVKKKKVLSILEKGAQRENLSDMTAEEMRSIIQAFYERSKIEQVELMGFERCESMLSDHKPVKALFSLDVKT